MPSITIRNVPEAVHRRLRVRAAKNGRSMEAELRVLLSLAAGLRRPPAPGGDSPAEAPPITLRSNEAVGEESAIDRIRDFLRTKAEESAA